MKDLCNDTHYWKLTRIKDNIKYLICTNCKLENLVHYSVMEIKNAP